VSLRLFTDLVGITHQGFIKQNGSYSSLYASHPLHQWVDCFWQLEVNCGDFTYRSVPDNCIDWIFNLHEPEESFIVTPFSSPLEFPIQGPESYFGIRFKILGFQGLVGIPVGEWKPACNYLDALHIVSPLLLEQGREALYRASSFSERCNLLSAVLLSELKYPNVDRRLARFIKFALGASVSGFDSAKLVRNDFGISDRQLRRLGSLYLGLSIKDYLKVARFQTMLHLIVTKGSKCDWAAHYYDQSHFIREFKDLAGTTPGKFLNTSVLYNSKTP
jgi:AraC-like DNA-binding protein